MIEAPEHIKTIKPYVPGKPIEELERELGITGSIKLASNENPLGPSPLALKAIRDALADINRYPDGQCFYLRDALSQKLEINTEEVLISNGSNEIIELAVRTFLRPCDEAIMAQPSFAVYPMIVQAAGGKNIIVPLKDFRHDLQAMASHITDRTRIIFIANPNNPTGTINIKSEMDDFMQSVPQGVLIVVDEAYHEYVISPEYPQSLKYFREGQDILILRTFSKIYGLAGLRIGYGIAKEKILIEMNKVRQPFNVNSIAQGAALAALRDEKHIAASKRINEIGKRYLYEELEVMNFEYVPTEANFIYIILKEENAFSLYEKLLRQGVIVRPIGEQEIRVTIGLPGENKRFIEALKSVISNR